MLNQRLDELHAAYRFFQHHVKLGAVAGGKQHCFVEVVIIAQAAQNAGYAVGAEVKASRTSTGAVLWFSPKTINCICNALL